MFPLPRNNNPSTPKNNDKNNNGVPDDVDRMIIGFFIGQALQAILLIIGLILVADVLKHLK